MTKIKKIAKSFGFAWRGIVMVAREEQNFGIELTAALVVAALAIILRVSHVEAAILVLVCGGVLVLELLNSALERVVDLVKPRLHHYVAEMKNISAGAVLIASITAVLVAVCLFAPRIAAILR